MNYRAVLRVYSLLRQLTDEESALLNTLRNMSESEQELMVETLSPQSKSAKKAGKKSATKSKRASGMAQAIKNSIGRAQPVQPGCAFIVNNKTGEMCMARDDDSIHDPTYISSHLFVHPDQQTQASAVGGGE